MGALVPRTLWNRTARVLPAINWELHVLQSGLDRIAIRRPWVGVPAVGALLVLMWGLYWALLPIILVACLVTRVLHPLESWLRRRS